MRIRAGEGPSLLSPGIHSFPFKLGLPLGLPSTFLGKHGWVQYYCKAALREPGGLTHKNQQVFIVMNPIDLNLEPPILAVSVSVTTLTDVLMSGLLITDFPLSISLSNLVKIYTIEPRLGVLICNRWKIIMRNQRDGQPDTVVGRP